MKRRTFFGRMGGLGALGGLMGIGALALVPRAASAQTSGTAGLSVPVTGQVGNSVDNTLWPGVITGADVSGSLTLTKFYAQGENLLADGFFSGSIVGEPSQIIAQFSGLRIPIAANNPSANLRQHQEQTCEILRLDLQGLFLNLLGLEINLAPVLLTIVANPAGGLLGQLLCSITNLLSGGLSGRLLQQLSYLLNRLLLILG